MSSKERNSSSFKTNGSWSHKPTASDIVSVDPIGDQTGIVRGGILAIGKEAKMDMRIVCDEFVYTPRSGSKIVVTTEVAKPFVKTLDNKARGSHILTGLWLKIVCCPAGGRGSERRAWRANAQALLASASTAMIAIDNCGELVLYMKDRAEGHISVERMGLIATLLIGLDLNDSEKLDLVMAFLNATATN